MDVKRSHTKYKHNQDRNWPREQTQKQKDSSKEFN